MKNIAVFVSGGGSNLQSLIDNMGDINGRICLVVSSKEGVYALERAKKHGIDSIVLSKSQEGFEDKLIKVLADRKIDLIVLAGYMSIIDKRIVQKYRHSIINIHPSLIPSFCGMGYYGIKVAQAMLSYGVKVAGATVHFVDEGADTGAIILQESIPILREDTAESLQKRVLEDVEHKLLPKAVKLFCDDRLEVTDRLVRIIKN